MKKVYKYEAGEKIPEKAIYLNTVTQTKRCGVNGDWYPCWLVWHYFLVEEEKTKCKNKN